MLANWAEEIAQLVKCLVPQRIPDAGEVETGRTRSLLDSQPSPISDPQTMERPCLKKQNWTLLQRRNDLWPLTPSCIHTTHFGAKLDTFVAEIQTGSSCAPVLILLSSVESQVHHVLEDTIHFSYFLKLFILLKMEGLNLMCSPLFWVSTEFRIWISDFLSHPIF